MRTGGALTVNPSNKNQKQRGFQLGADQASLQAQQQRYQGIIDKKGGNAPKAQQRLKKINNAMGALNTNPSVNTQQPAPEPTQQQQGFDNVTNNSNQYLNNVFGQLQNQGQFNPGNYQDMRQKASDTAMNEFNRQNQPRFQQEDADFEQQMAAQGIDSTTEKYKRLKGDMMQNRNSAIQGAQNNAFQMGQGEQSQAYNQQYNTWQAPLQAMQASQPFYGYQNQQQMQQGAQQWQTGENQADRNLQTGMQQGGFDFQKELAGLQHKYNMQLQASAPRGGGGGGGGLSFDQQMALQNNSADRQFYNNMVMYGIQNGNQLPQGGATQGLTNGIASGVTAGVTNALTR
jgi:hypothetical protein